LAAAAALSVLVGVGDGDGLGEGEALGDGLGVGVGDGVETLPPPVDPPPLQAATPSAPARARVSRRVRDRILSLLLAARLRACTTGFGSG
jgi:hypothetical protein